MTDAVLIQLIIAVPTIIGSITALIVALKSKSESKSANTKSDLAMDYSLETKKFATEAFKRQSDTA
jgi:hypothetical protein